MGRRLEPRVDDVACRVLSPRPCEQVLAESRVPVSGLLSGAAVLAWFGLGAAIATAIIALALALPLWASALIVTAAVFVAAGVLGLMGRNATQQVSPTPERTVRNVKRDVEEVQEARHRDHTR